MHDVDVIVVGQGLAGSLLVRRLLQANKSVVVFDKNEPSTSSKIAAGLVNPITGRRFVLSWQFNLLNTEARKFYSAWEDEMQHKLIYEMPIIRAMQDHRFIDDVEAKTSDEYYQDFIEATTLSDDSYIKLSPILYKINKAYRVDIQKIIEYTRDELLKKGLLIDEAMEYEQISLVEKGVRYKNIRAKYMIFCEGAGGQKNPWFNYLPFQPTKGELFELKQPGLLPFAYKKDLILLPKGDDILWCGSLNYWEFIDSEPNQDGERILLQKLRSTYKPDPFIHRHLAAIRPTVRDRRPLIGRHLSFPQLLIFNGLGTKGTILAPYFSKQLVDHVYEHTALMKEADIKRFA